VHRSRRDAADDPRRHRILTDVLTTVLDRLTTLASRHFVVAAFVPVLVCATVNGAVLYLEFDWFRSWASPQISGTARTFDAALIFIGLAVFAHLLWSINGFLRQVLEGRHLRENSALGRRLRQRQLERLRALRKECYDSRNTAAEIAKQTPRWTEDLSQAAVKGMTTGKNDYDGAENAAKTALNNLRDRRTRAEEITVAQLKQAVDTFKAVLEKNNINQEPRPNLLSADRRDLLALFDYAVDEARAREVARANELQARFGATAPAPTALGNVGESMQSYALTRYGLNLTTFWSRLQPVLQKQTDFYSMLQEAKVQLDFLVLSVFLSALTTLVWVVVLPFWGRSPWVFLAIASLGPVATVVSYRAAIENYVAFGEIVRTGIDLYRLDLLDALHLQRPVSLRQERIVWDTLRRVTSFGQEWVDFSYQPPREKQT
jgi:hypothetical protein